MVYQQLDILRHINFFLTTLSLAFQPVQWLHVTGTVQLFSQKNIGQFIPPGLIKQGGRGRVVVVVVGGDRQLFLSQWISSSSKAFTYGRHQTSHTPFNVLNTLLWPLQYKVYMKTSQHEQSHSTPHYSLPSIRWSVR